MDTKAAELSSLNEVAAVQNPTYITLDERDTSILVQQIVMVEESPPLILMAKLLLISEMSQTTGAPLCYVAVDEARQLVYGANYHLGEVRVYKIQANGSLRLTDTVKHTGSGPRPEQSSSHVHYSDLTPDGRLVTCDLGTDEGHCL